MKNLSLKMRRFASYYARVTTGEVADEDVRRALTRLALLQMPVVNPLLLALFDAWDHQALSREEFLCVLGTLESYLLRRTVCDCDGSVLPGFVASLLARLDAVRAEEGRLAEAFDAMLLNEAGGPRHMPQDAEFAHALATRDCFGFSRAFYLLARLEEDMSGIMPQRSAWTIEHVMPVRALEDDAWRTALADAARDGGGSLPESQELQLDQVFEGCVNLLGNLVLTQADFDLQDGSLEDKQARIKATGQPPALSAEVLASSGWGVQEIRSRTDALVGRACALWRVPDLPEEARRAYRPSRAVMPGEQASFADLFEAGLVEMDDVLASANPLYPGHASVTSRGRIMLANGEMFDDPSAAYERFVSLLGSSAPGINGWLYWRRGEGGPLLDTLREAL
jgi:hypothetical protein